MNARYILIPAAVLFLLASCSSVAWEEVDLMPPPDVYGDGPRPAD